LVDIKSFVQPSNERVIIDRYEWKSKQKRSKQ